MLWYEIKLIARKIKKNNIFSFINIIGLSLGITCCILAFLYIQDEIKYDKCFKNADNIYCITGNNFNGNDWTYGQPARFLSEILNEIPEIESGIRMMSHPVDIFVNGNYFSVTDFIYTDSNFFSFFNWKLISGDPENVLTKPFTLAISDAKAGEYFGNQNPIGKKIKVNNYHDYIITGVFKSFPDQSHIQTHFIVSNQTLKRTNNRYFTSIGWFGSDIYLKTRPGVNISYVNDKLTNTWYKLCEKTTRQDNFSSLALQPFYNMYLKSNHLAKRAQYSSIYNVIGFAIIAAFILIIASFNFINLSTALISKRNTETGIKKTLGAGKLVFSRQSFIESAIYVCISVIISLLLIFLLLPFYNNFIGKQLSINLLGNIPFLLFIICISLLLLFGTSIYPVFYMAKVNPVSMLKGSKLMVSRAGKGSFWNGLVVLQFTFGIMLILSSIIVSKQIRLIKTRDIGINNEHILVLDNPGANKNRYIIFKEQIEKYPEIEMVSSGNEVPHIRISNWGGPEIKNNRNIQVHSCGFVSVDYNYFTLLGSQFTMGRNFIENNKIDEKKIIVTETFMEKLAVENPIGVTLTDLWDGIDREIVGVIKDIEFNPIHSKIKPTLFFCHHKELNSQQYILVKIKSSDLSNTIKVIEKEWEAIAPKWPIDYFFLDDRFNKNYRKETQTATVINILTGMAIFLSCLGLFGLVLFTINGRIKEIGVRKVNGAGVNEILGLLNKDFLSWILIAYLIAVPVSLFFMREWLNNFAYKIKLNVWIFLATGAISLFLALITISWQSWRAARRNPVEALRYE